MHVCKIRCDGESYKVLDNKAFIRFIATPIYGATPLSALVPSLMGSASVKSK